MAKEEPRSKEPLQEKSNLWLRPFLIGLFLSGIILVPILVAATLVLPLDEWFALEPPLHPGDWVVYGTVVAIVLSCFFGLMFARSITPENKKG